VVKPQVNFPPTLKEVEEFAEKAMIGFNVRQFYYYYESNGWLEGGEKIRDWKRCLISWQRSRDVRQFAAQEDYKIIREEKEAKLKEAASRYDFDNIYNDLDELIAEIDAKTEKENRENGENKKPDYSSIWD